MKYKGGTITPIYLINLKELRDGRVVEQKPKKEHLDYYEVIDHTGFKCYPASTIQEAKETLRRNLEIETSVEVEGGR